MDVRVNKNDKMVAKDSGPEGPAAVLVGDR